MIPFKNRFHGHNSLRFVYKNGQAIRSRFITMKSTSNPHRKNSRVAVVISKKVLKSAVRRNRVRRRIYEYIRPKLDTITDTYDIVVIVSSSEPLNLPHNELVDQLDQLFIQSGIK